MCNIFPDQKYYSNLLFQSIEFKDINLNVINGIKYMSFAKNLMGFFPLSWFLASKIYVQVAHVLALK